MDRLQDILQEQDFMDILRQRTTLGGRLRSVIKKIRDRKPGLFLKKTAKGKRELAKAIKAVAATGVDRISVGSITHSAPSIDLKLEI